MIHVIGSYQPDTTKAVVSQSGGTGTYGSNEGMSSVLQFAVNNLVFMAVAGGLTTLCVMISLVTSQFLEFGHFNISMF